MAASTGAAPFGARSVGASALDYLVVGHVAADWIEGSHRPLLGGTATYAALTALRLGARVGVHTSASYEPGLVDVLHGVHVARIPAEYSTTFANRYEADGTRTQTVESVADRLTFDQILPEWRGAPLVHLAPIAQEVDPGLLDRFPRAFLGITPQGWLRAWGDDGGVHRAEWRDAKRVLRRANAVVVSEADLPDPALVDEWARVAHLLVVTRGERGCDVYHAGEDPATPYHSPAFKVPRVIDPTGAGDAFAAAYFWHLHQAGNWREAADWANCVASFVVEKRGPAGVPRLADAEARWRSNARATASPGAPVRSGAGS